MNTASRRLGTAGVAIAAAAAMVAVPAFAHITPVEQANKQVVLDFYAGLNAADAAGTTARQAETIIKKYIAPGYHQHSETFRNLPGKGTDRDKLIRMFQSMPARPPNGGAPAMQKTDAIMAEGDLVMMLTSRSHTDPSGNEHTNYTFNMFRVKDGKLVEHWDVSPSPSGSPPGGGAGGPGARPAGGPPPNSP